MELGGKIALVTGSSQGIGQAIAARLAKEGANIIIDYRSHSEGAEQTRSLVEAAGANAAVVKADLSSVEQIGYLMLAIKAGRKKSARRNLAVVI